MPYVKVSDEADSAGRKRVIGYTTNDGSPRTSDPDAIEVDSLNRPEVESHQRAVPWLASSGEVEWDVEERPSDDPAQVARRLDALDQDIDQLVLAQIGGQS